MTTTQPTIPLLLIAATMAIAMSNGAFDVVDCILGISFLLYFRFEEMRPDRISDRVLLSCLQGLLWLSVIGYLVSRVFFIFFISKLPQLAWLWAYPSVFAFFFWMIVSRIHYNKLIHKCRFQ